MRNTTRAALAIVFLLVNASVLAKSSDVPICKLDADVAAHSRSDEDVDPEHNAVVVAVPLSTEGIPPAENPARCGRGSDLIDTLKSSHFRSKFSNGTAVDFYPILLTDKKTGLWTCDKIKVRSACLTSNRNEDGTLSITMKATDKRLTVQETHTVLNDGSVRPSQDTRFFVLMPRFKKKRDGSLVDRGDAMLAAADKAKCDNLSPACKDKKNVLVERAALQELRRIRLSRILNASDRSNDARDLLNWAQRLSGDRKLIHLAIAASEVGWTPSASTVIDSPFEVVDAILGNSGPSFGIHQIDLATNGTEDVVPFRKIMPAVLAELPAGTALSLQPPRGAIGSSPFKFEKPIRGWDISLAADFYKAVPAMVRQIRTPEFRAVYADQYNKYLEGAAGCMAALASRGGIFAVSKVAQLYVMDVDNQFGSGRSNRLAKFALSLNTSVIDGAETSMRDFMIENTPYGATFEGARDIRRRFSNIRSIVGDSSPETSSQLNNCSVKALAKRPAA